MIKFESYLINSNDNNKDSTFLIENKTSSIPILLCLDSSDLIAVAIFVTYPLNPSQLFVT